MKNVPQLIYLQVDADGEMPEDFSQLAGVTWSCERIHETDLVFELKPREKYRVHAYGKGGYRESKTVNTREEALELAESWRESKRFKRVYFNKITR